MGQEALVSRRATESAEAWTRPPQVQSLVLNADGRPPEWGGEGRRPRSEREKGPLLSAGKNSDASSQKGSLLEKGKAKTGGKAQVTRHSVFVNYSLETVRRFPVKGGGGEGGGKAGGACDSSSLSSGRSPWF